MRGRFVAALGPVLLVALAGCTGGDRDSDKDGLSDALERDGWDVEIALVGGDVETRRVKSDPHRTDPDGDGAGDLVEWILGLDPSNPDADLDGLLDDSDVVLDPGDPLAAAFDRAGIVSTPEPDGKIRFHGERTYHTDPRNQDSDAPEGDGLMDGDEVRGWDLVILGEALHVPTDPFAWDSDGDFVSDADEFEYGTHPRKADTDGDGVSDSRDLNPLGNLRLDLRYETIRMFTDKDPAEPFKAADLYLDAYLPGFLPHRSREIDVPEGSEADTSSVSPGVLDVPDEGANFRDRDFNVTLSMFAYDRDAASSESIDVYSRTTDLNQMNVRFDVHSGRWTIAGSNETGGGDIAIEGEDARLVISIRAL